MFEHADGTFGGVASVDDRWCEFDVNGGYVKKNIEFG